MGHPVKLNVFLLSCVPGQVCHVRHDVRHEEGRAHLLGHEGAQALLAAAAPGRSGDALEVLLRVPPVWGAVFDSPATGLD